MDAYTALRIRVHIHVEQRLIPLHCPIHIQHGDILRRACQAGIGLSLGVCNDSGIFQCGHQLPDIGWVRLNAFRNTRAGHTLLCSQADAVLVGAGSGLSSAAGYNHYHWTPAIESYLQEFKNTTNLHHLLQDSTIVIRHWNNSGLTISKQAIRELKAAGVQKTVMLTGDARRVAEQVAKDLGVDQVYSQLLPADKVEKVESLLKDKPEKAKLAFVGDGINDAPVLGRADIGIAMGAMGSDAAI